MSVNIRGKCNSCCVPGCNSNSTPSFRNRGGRITTFKLPRDEARRKEWIQAIPKRKYPPTVNSNVCILHFNEEDFSRNNRRIDLKKSAVPSIFPFVDGQRTDESTDISDEVWIEYVAHKNASLHSTIEEVYNDLPPPTSDISRILIERLRIPGSKYFGIDTAEITIEPPDSDSESDIYESKVTVNKTSSTGPSKHKIRKKVKCEDDYSANELNDNCDDMIGFRDDASEDDSNDKVTQFSMERNNTTPSDSDDKFGAMVSSKLLLMSPLQRLMSEKIINEILLKGQMGMLKSSLSPVVVTGYMKNASNGVTSDDCKVAMCGGSDDSGSDDTDDCGDPLMFPGRQETIRSTNIEQVDFVKNEICWTDDDEI